MALAEPVQSVILAEVEHRLIEGKFLNFRRLIDIIIGLIPSGLLSWENFDDTVTHTEYLYDKHVRPYDLPGIPNFIEPHVDDIIKAMISPILYRVFETILGPEDSTPTTIPET